MVLTPVEMGGRFRFTRKQWYLMVALGSIKFAISLSTSLQGPSFPREAETKGSTASEYGLVFGVHSLVAFISCPIYGHYINRIGAKKMLNYGMFLAGISIIGFGLLNLIDSHVPFITMAFVMRILESLGKAAAITASHSITAVVFYDSIATSFAITEAFFGMGCMLGPILWGCLYQIGGYMLPFMAVGLLLLIEAAMIFFLFPDINDHRNLDFTQVRMSSVLTLPPVCLDLFSTTAATVVMGFIVATLEPHLRQFDLTPVTVGAIFMISTGVYSILAPLVGCLCDKRFYPKKVIIVGGILFFVGISLVGPAPFLPMDTTLWVICVGFIFNGLGHACIIVPAFIDAIQSSVVALGLPNDMALYGVVTGLVQSAYSLGEAIGPSIAGVLFDSVGFRNGTLFLLAIQAILVVAMTLYVCTERRGKRLLLIEPALKYGSIAKSNDDEQNSGCNSQSNRCVYYSSD